MAGTKRKMDYKSRGAPEKRLKTSFSNVNMRMTRSMHKFKSVAAARNGVIHTTELLESVLVNLDPISIIKCMHVDKRFHECITHSPRLQELLFLRPGRRSREKWTEADELIEKEHGAKLEIVRGKEFVRGNRMPTFSPRYGQSQLVRDAPVLTRARLCPALRLETKINQGDQNLCKTRMTVSPHALTQKPWMDMQITNPPCFHALVEIRYTRESDTRTVTAADWISNEKGVTLSQVWRAGHHTTTGLMHSWKLQGWKREAYEVEMLEDTTLAKTLKDFRKRYGGEWQLSETLLAIYPLDIKVPSDNERLQPDTASAAPVK